MGEYIPPTLDWVRKQVEVYEGSGGTKGTTLLETGLPCIIVTHTSNRTGGIRKIPLMRVKVEATRGEAQFVLEAMVTWSGSNPSAATSSTSRTEQETDSRELESKDNTAQAERERAKGEVKTAPSTVAQLGYPFRFVMLTENRKF